jgi:hypothetical protein
MYRRRRRRGIPEQPYNYGRHSKPSVFSLLSALGAHVAWAWPNTPASLPSYTQTHTHTHILLYVMYMYIHTNEQTLKHTHTQTAWTFHRHDDRSINRCIRYNNNIPIHP